MKSGQTYYCRVVSVKPGGSCQLELIDPETLDVQSEQALGIRRHIKTPVRVNFNAIIGLLGVCHIMPNPETPEGWMGENIRLIPPQVSAKE